MFIGDTLASTMVPLAGNRDLPNLTMSMSAIGAEKTDDWKGDVDDWNDDDNDDPNWRSR